MSRPSTDENLRPLHMRWLTFLTNLREAVVCCDGTFSTSQPLTFWCFCNCFFLNRPATTS